jgi:hypothetical protein
MTLRARWHAVKPGARERYLGLLKTGHDGSPNS